MSRKGTGMRKIREVLRLRFEHGLSARQIAASCRLSPSTVGRIVDGASKAGITWPLPEGYDENDLRNRIYHNSEGGVEDSSRPLPDMEKVARELSRKGVTLKLLWEEYFRNHPDGYSYNQFCVHFRRWRGSRKEPTARFDHKAGETMFVDWSGGHFEYRTEKGTGKASLFVATLGASNYTYASVFPDMRSPSWIRGHVEAFEYFGGVPEVICPDNVKTGVVSCCRYDPELNPSYQELAEHYGTVVIPARPGKPRDKGKVENGVQFAQRWIMAALRNVTFLSFGELKKAVRRKVDELNDRPFSKMEGSRRGAFESLERDALRPLPSSAHSFGEWKTLTVHEDYHVQAGNHYYSVPYRHIGHRVEARLTDSIVEIFRNGERIALHQRSFEKGKATTLKEHMPPQHFHFISQTVNSYLDKAEKIGPKCAAAVDGIVHSFPRPEMAFRSCQGVMRLARKHGPERLERACAKALEAGACKYRTIEGILENRLENTAIFPSSKRQVGPHRNLRGGDYYGHNGKEAASC